MKKRSYLLLRGWGMILVICILLAYLITGRYDSEGLYIGIAIISTLVLVAFNLFRQAEKAKPTEMAYAPPSDVSDKQKIKFYKRIIVLVAVAFSLATAMVILDFNAITTSTDPSEIYLLVHYTYIHAGYWPAMLIVPAIGLLCILAMVRKINVVKSDSERI